MAEHDTVTGAPAHINPCLQSIAAIRSGDRYDKAEQARPLH